MMTSSEKDEAKTLTWEFWDRCGEICVKLEFKPPRISILTKHDVVAVVNCCHEANLRVFLLGALHASDEHGRAGLDVWVSAVWGAINAASLPWSKIERKDGTPSEPPNHVAMRHPDPRPMFFDPVAHE